ncbi:MAG: response regulator [Fuerstiella sp.]
MANRSIHILLVDDDDVDVRVVRRAFERQKICNPLTVARDGVEALQRLRGENGFEALPHPLMVLLDLNMPRMGGLQFLEHLRNDPNLHRTIVFVLTTSKAESDREAAYDHNISGYLVKSDAGRDLVKHMPMLENFLLCVQFPDQHQPQTTVGSSATIA